MNRLVIAFAVIVLLFTVAGCGDSADLNGLRATEEGMYTVHMFGEQDSPREMGTAFTAFWNEEALGLIEGVQLYGGQPKDRVLRKALDIEEFPTIVIFDSDGEVRRVQRLEDVYAFFRGLQG